MCGFLGVSNKSFYHRKEDLINTSFKWIKHRGPDESKTLLLEKFFRTKKNKEIFYFGIFWKL